MKRSVSILWVVTLLFLILPNMHQSIVEAAKASPDPIKIVIDPGHGGRDPGAIGVNGLQEKNVNLDVALRLKEILVQAGYQVIMTRETDRLLVDYKGSSQKYMDLQARVDVATKEKADLFVSIHSNDYGPSSQGTLVLYYDVMNQSKVYPATEAMKKWSNESKTLARNVLNSITSKMGTKSLGIDPSNVYVVRNGTVPSILVETAFLSNRAEAEKLANPVFRRGMAESIAAGIMSYLPPRYIDIRDNWAKKEIASLSYMGIIKGYQDRLFRPEIHLSRVELISLLDKAISFDDLLELRLNNQDPEQTQVKFSDIPEDYWAHSEILNAERLGIIKGYPDGTFRPTQKVSREEIAAFLYRAFYAKAENNEQSNENAEAGLNGNDEEIPTGNEAVNQTEDSLDQPTNPTNEQEATDQLTNQPIDQSTMTSPINGTVPFIDVPNDHWSISAIQTLNSLGIIKGLKGDLFGLGKNVTRAEAATMIYRILIQIEGQPVLAKINP